MYLIILFLTSDILAEFSLNLQEQVVERLDIRAFDEWTQRIDDGVKPFGCTRRKLDINWYIN